MAKGMTLYLFMDIGCRDCGAPSDVVMVSDDLEKIKVEWADRVGAPFEVRSPDYPSEWPDNVVALDGGSDHANVVYETEVR